MTSATRSTASGPTPTRQRIVEAGARLFWRHGYTATGMKQVVAEAAAPFGSVYHFFPGGKEELGAEAVRWAGVQYGDLVEAVFLALRSGTDDLAEVMVGLFVGAGDTVRDSEWADACPIATVALEMSSESEPIRVACADTFSSWLDRLDVLLGDAGLPSARRRDLSMSFLMLLEGGFLLARASRSVEPMRVAGEAMATLCRHATSIS